MSLKLVQRCWHGFESQPGYEGVGKFKNKSYPRHLWVNKHRISERTGKNLRTVANIINIITHQSRLSFNHRRLEIVYLRVIKILVCSIMVPVQGVEPRIINCVTHNQVLLTTVPLSLAARVCKLKSIFPKLFLKLKNLKFGLQYIGQMFNGRTNKCIRWLLLKKIARGRMCSLVAGKLCWFLNEIVTPLEIVTYGLCVVWNTKVNQ